MTSLTGVFIFFLLKAEPEVDLSFQGVPGCRREEQGQWGRAGGRAHGAAVTGLLTVMEGGPHLLGCLRGSRSHGSQDVCFEGNIMFGGQDPKQYQIGVLCLLYLIP